MAIGTELITGHPLEKKLLCCNEIIEWIFLLSYMCIDNLKQVYDNR